MEDVVRWAPFEASGRPVFGAVTERGLARLSWTECHDEESFRSAVEAAFPGRSVARDARALEPVRLQLAEYFEGRRERFDLAVDLSRVTAFQRRVYGKLRRVPHGEVISYGELARRIGRPRAARAVGNALGKNPVAIVVPCHRVIRSDGTLGGYSGGLPFKRRLLAVEGREGRVRAG